MAGLLRPWLSSIAGRLLVWFLGIALVPLIAALYLQHAAADRTVRGEVASKVRALAESRAQQLETHAAERRGDMMALARMPALVDALARRPRAAALPAEVDLSLRDYLATFAESYGHLDILLVGPAGEELFTLTHRGEPGTNYSTGPYRDTALAQVIDRVRALREPQFSAFAPCPRVSGPALYVAAPVLQGPRLLGIAVIQINHAPIYRLAADTIGLGDTGELVLGTLVGERMVFLAPTRHDPEAAFQRTTALGDATARPLQEAVRGLGGEGVGIDYRGERAVAAWRHLPSWDWGMVVKIDADEAFAPLAQQRREGLFVGLATCVVVGLLALVVARSVSRPLVHLTEGARRLAGGDLQQTVPAAGRDEVGELARAFNTMAAELRTLYGSLDEKIRQRTLELEREIGERRRTEEALRVSEERFRNAFDHAPIGMALLTGDGRWMQVNRALCAITGYTEDEMLARTFQDITHPDDLEADLAQARRMLGGEIDFYEMEKRYLRRNGSVVWVLLSVSRAHTEGTNPQFFIAQVQDISDRKESEVVLAERGRLAALTADVSLALTREESLAGILQRCTEALVQHLGAAFARIWTLNEAATVLELQASAGMYTHLNGPHSRVPVGKFKIGLIAQERKPHLTNAVQTDPRIGDPAWARREGMVAFAGHPLLVGGRLAGVMALFARQPLSPSTLNALAVVADVVALGIERRRAEDRLRDSETRFRRITTSMLDLIGQANSDGILEYVTPSNQVVLGYRPEEMVGRSAFALVHPDDQERVLALFQKGMQSGQPARTEFRYRHADGHYLWLECVGNILLNDAGQPCGAIFASRDISERKRTEEALRASEETLRTISDTALDAVILMNSAGTILHWNPAAERMFGYTRAEIVGRNLHDTLTPPRYRAQFEPGLARFAATGQGPVIGRVQELEGVRKDGSTFPADLSVAAICLRGEWNAVGVLRDVTERKRAEAELRRAKEAAEAASRAKGEFLANMSHEIRTPMNGILGMTELALDTELTAEQRDYLTTVRDSAEGLLTILNDILDFSKIEAGKLELDLAPFRLRQLVTSILKGLKLRAEQKGLELTSHVAADVPDVLVGDAGRLRQVLLNLLGNAIKFTEKGEVALLVVRAEPSADGQPPPGATLHVTVRDTGIGIPPEQRSQIFEAFRQAEASITRRYGGTGLGLSIAARLVELMGGRIWVESEVGKGSAFHFLVPVDVRPEEELPTAPATPEPRTAATPSRQLRVLLAEDNEVNQKLTARLLTKWGHDVTVAANGREALAALAREPFDIVLMDVQMPEMDGLEATAALRSQERATGRHLPVIAMTAYAMKGDQERCLAAGCDGYVAKPVRREELFEALERLTATGASAPDGPARPGAAPPTTTAEVVFDHADALDRVEGDASFLRDMARLFLAGLPTMLARVNEAVATRDAGRIQQAAHSVKGSAGCLGGRAVAAAARALEEQSRTGDLAGVDGALAALHEALERFRQALEEYSAS